ncbi:hypothetical protein GIB67_034652 [Kingdonia uniflora]|uniref:DUF4218 domain-containing protein n=1 Tax=Kingdonia uniflora TaxID=39325 RepID=A0A7J7P0E5_9MAGN|nr:hypothetical protein GIB67_034652 [Kingdonia uniflora]
MLFSPKSPFTLDRAENESFCRILHELKVPIGYSSNWKHNVNMEELQLKGLKSHDYYILIQHLLPVLLMHAFKNEKPLLIALGQVSRFFNVICSKTIQGDELKVMGDRLVESLCLFEKYFPPSFFVSMVHLVLHLAEEVTKCGPARYRWMYNFERRGSYKQGKPLFMDDDPDDEQPMGKNGKNITLENIKFEQVCKWVLSCFDGVEEWEEKHKNYLNEQLRASRGRGARSNVKPMAFIPWLRQQLEKDKMSTLKRLADGPSFKVVSYKGYRINGHVFYTKDSESYKVNGCKIDPETNLTFVNLVRLKGNSNQNDEPFCLASQASRVFYCKDPSKDAWYAVIDAPQRLTKDIEAYEDPLVFEARTLASMAMSTLLNDLVDEDEEIVEGTWVMPISSRRRSMPSDKIEDSSNLVPQRASTSPVLTLQNEYELPLAAKDQVLIGSNIAWKKKNRSEDFETTRTNYFLAGHTCSNGSFLTPFIEAKVAEIKLNVEKNPESKHYDMDDDPVGQAYGPEKKGRVRGEGILVTKSMLKHMKHGRTIIKEGKLEYKEINNKLNVIIDEVKTLKENATREGHRMQNASPYHTSEDEVVAAGRAIFPRNQINNPNEYDVFVDLVIDEDAEVYGRRGMFFRDIPVGEWFKYPSFLLKIIDEHLIGLGHVPMSLRKIVRMLGMQQIDVMRAYIAQVSIAARDAQVKGTYRSSLNHIQTHKENFNKLQLVSLECNNQFQNGMHLPLVMGGAQQGQPISWIPDNDREHVMLSEDPNLLPQRLVDILVNSN